ncbi:MAG: glutathione peroxidase [Candidatus Hydrogenedentes bacterium]|nr:glutathione peroxidase [Candidatus Hydrogenedentota bacterium]
MSILRKIVRRVIRGAGSVLPPKNGKGADISSCEVQKADGSPIKIGERYNNQVLMIVNVASKCGFTPQYEALQSLHARYKDRGFEVLAFPCNEFGGQEPGTNEDIREFCRINFKTDFEIFDKVRVSGNDAAPLFKTLTSEPNGTLAGAIKWNFTKFLVARDGHVIARIEPPTPPDAPRVIALIEDALK